MREIELAVGFQHGVWVSEFVSTDLPDIELMDEQKLVALLPEHLQHRKNISFIHLLHIGEEE
jgi:hypothetical protein